MKKKSKKNRDIKPNSIKPMLATLVDKPFNDEDWLFEIKLDGFRAIAELDNNNIQLYSRNLLSFKQRFPTLIHHLKDLSLDAILDGEIVVLNKQGVSEFQKLQNFNSYSDIYYYVFDILYWNGQDLRNYPLTERKAILQKIIDKDSQIRYLDHVEKSGLEFFKFCQEKGLEGMVAKKKESLYSEGIRSKSWLKIKNEHLQEAVICGFTEPLGGRKGFGALVVGFYNKRKLHFSGHVGGGFTVKQISEIKALLSPLIVLDCPFESVPKTNTKVTWVTPKYICEVKFKELTSEGIMRQPIFQGLRMDKSQKEVLEEKPKPIESVHKKVKQSKSSKEKKEGLPAAKKGKGKNIDLVRCKQSPCPIKLRQSPGVEGSKVTQYLLEEFPFLTHLDKFYWEKEKITKGEVLKYYASIADVMLPYLVDRPQVLKRFPNGASQASFYQKNLENHPDWISTIAIQHENRTIDYLLIEDLKSLLYAVNLGCIEIHSWFSSVQNLNNPDILILDLDPEDISFEAVIEIAILLHEILEKYKIPHFCKTSGSRGLH
ncbi:MAG: DNA ligase D, partial [Nitrosopumilus sp.]|nr:DNA ligase D [Nitrosopumilus sp.]